ncbi:recombinase family protein [Calothrix sp. PCC 6303]|uniref:recombinase family protein n=1 Tax=Calothrix sp. PCC 6303 TaxID=1170562 RepID=UPI0002A03F54|nr:recombinase family protein [Calothrix sp. PCC 6303]AFZ00007.1 Recombinase [Calothrix sp. PCC 6303]
MKIYAYSYTDPLLDESPPKHIWGWEVDHVYEDLGKRRTQLQKLLEDCHIQPPEYLLIRQLQELGDSVAEINSRVTELKGLGVKIVAVEENHSFSDSHIQLIELLQELQYQQRSRRIRQGHARNRLNIAPPPGKAPYGYKKGKSKYILDKTTAPVVKDFFENFLLYASLRGAVRYLAKKYNKKISVTTGKRWLINPVYRGDTAYKNHQIILDTHTAIISREEGAQVDRILRRNSSLPKRTASAPRSLAGLVVCGECKSSMKVGLVTRRDRVQEYLYLRPIDCPKTPKCRAISYDAVLEKTIEVVCRELPLAVAGTNFPQLDAVKNQLSEKILHQQEIIQQIPNLFESGILDQETAKIRIYQLNTEISTLTAKLNSLPPANLSSIAQAVSIPQFWFDLSESERRFYLREFIQNIQLIRQKDTWELDIVFIF